MEMLVVWSAAVCLGVIIAARWLFGPFEIFGIPVHAPLNVEGAFGAMIVFLLAAQRPTVEPATLPPRRLWPAWATFGVALLALFPALSVYFLSDDFIIVRGANAATPANLAHAWTHAGGDGFFRPLGYISFALDAAWARFDPLWWHLSSILLHAANAALVAILAMRWRMPALAAFAAGAIFALHGTHLEAAVWIAGRFDLLATFFTLAALLLYGRNTILAILAAAAALCSKEAAFVLPLLLVVMARYEKRPLSTTAPFFGLAAAIFAYRWFLLGGIGGYRDAAGEPSVLGLKVATTAKVIFARLWTSLFFPLNWSQDPALLIGVLAALYTASLVWIARKPEPRPTLRWSLAALGIAILPPLHLLGGAADLSGGRLLYLPSVFFCLFLASVIPQRVAAIAIVLAFFAITLHHDLNFWQAASRRVAAICVNPPPLPWPGRIDGVPALANGVEECVGFPVKYQR